ncbi:MAG: FecR domain-containing protein [Ginsengibacter sp.]
MKENYNNSEDFLDDQSFVSWVFKSDKKDIAEWDTWLSNNPAKVLMANDAASILNLTRLKDIPVSTQQLAEAEARLRFSLQADFTPAKIINFKRRKVWYAVAAILIISLAVGLSLIFNSPEKSQFATNYGQVKSDKLPDGTEVILNAHSTISYGKQWKNGTDREVWIKGEAFFHVKRTPSHDKFIVHTDAFDIEVTGTSFNVINLDGKSSIILKEGSVKIHRTDEAEIIMKPGDFVEFSNKQIQKKTVTKQDYIAWTDNKLVFDNTSLTDVANIIKEHYGVDVILKGRNIAAETITGIMPNNNLEVLLQALDATQEINVVRTKDSITIITEVQ